MHTTYVISDGFYFWSTVYQCQRHDITEFVKVTSDCYRRASDRSIQ